MQRGCLELSGVVRSCLEDPAVYIFCVTVSLTPIGSLAFSERHDRCSVRVVIVGDPLTDKADLQAFFINRFFGNLCTCEVQLISIYRVVFTITITITTPNASDAVVSP
jgi:hypothetical protein